MIDLQEDGGYVVPYLYIRYQKYSDNWFGPALENVLKLAE